METDLDVLVLLREIRELRRQVEELRTADGRRRLTLSVDRERPLLGQPVTVTARLIDGGSPRSGARLVLTATGGHLRLPEAVEAPGAALDLRTGADGTARVVLVPPTAEEPTTDQTEALLTSLAGIDAAAPTPEEAREGLEAMARQYRWEPSRELRGAVDLLFRERRAGLAEAINPLAPLAAWIMVPAAVTVHLVGADGAVEATATVHLQVLDWLPAWYQVYLDVSLADPTLTAELDLAREAGGTDADTLLDHLQDRVQGYVAGHRGLAGELVGRKVAEDSLRGFAEKRLDDLSPETRVKVFQGVQSTSRTLAVAGPVVLAGVGQVRRDARRDVTTRLGGIEGKVVELGQVAGRLQGIEGKVVEISGALQAKADLTEVRTFHEETRRTLATKVDTTRFDEILRNKVDVTIFTGFQTETRGTLQGKADLTEVTTLREETRRTLATKVDTTRFDDVLRNKLDVTIFTGFQTETLGTLRAKADVAEITTLREETRRTLATKVDTTRFDDVLRNKLDVTVFTGFQTETLGTLRAKADLAEVTTLREETRRTLDAKVDVTTFDSHQQVVATNFSTLQGRVTGFTAVRPDFIIRRGGNP